MARAPSRARQGALPVPRFRTHVPETQREDIREIIVSPYRVLYRRRDDRVEIVAIRHEARAFDEREVSP